MAAEGRDLLAGGKDVLAGSVAAGRDLLASDEPSTLEAAGAGARGLVKGALGFPGAIESMFTEEGAFRYDPKTGDWNRVAQYDTQTGQYVTEPQFKGEFGDVYTPSDYSQSYGQSIGKETGYAVGKLVNRELFSETPSKTYSTGGETGGTGTTGAGGGGGQVLAPQISAGSSALAQALRSTPTGAVGGGGVEPSSGEGSQENVWNVSSLKLKDALGA